MNKIIEHALIVLEKQDDWMTRDDLKNEVLRVFPNANMQTVYNYLYGRANIGYDSAGGFRWYKPNKLTAQVQACLNRGEDW
jgi:hypothetical protein